MINADQGRMLDRMDVLEETLDKMNAAWKVCLGETETSQESNKPAQQLCHLNEISCLANKNKKFWEELIAYFPFTITLISDATSRKKT
jgi:hypothetical protein